MPGARRFLLKALQPTEPRVRYSQSTVSHPGLKELVSGSGQSGRSWQPGLSMTVRVGIVGGGGMAGVHARSLAAMPSARLVSLGAPQVRSEVARTVRAAGGEVTDAKTVLSRGDLDAVVIATPNDTHADLILAAIDAGMAVFCEKPMTADLGQAAAVMAAIGRSGAKLAIGHVVRYFPVYEAVRREVTAGSVGIPGVARMRRAGGEPGGWYGDPVQSGGVVYDLAIHNIDWALWTLGPAERICAVVVGPPSRQTAMITLAHRSGALSLIEASWDRPHGFLTSVEVSGSEGLIRSDSTAPASFRFNARGDAAARPAITDVSAEADPYQRELEEALAWFAGGDPPRATGADGFAAVCVAAAALESAKTGGPVTLGSSGGPES